MPVLAAAIGTMLMSIAGSIALQVLVGLGISVITYTGLSTTLDWLKTGALNGLNGLPVQLLGILAALKVGTCISMVFSAYAARMTVTGITNGTFKSWIKR